MADLEGFDNNGQMGTDINFDDDEPMQHDQKQNLNQQNSQSQRMYDPLQEQINQKTKDFESLIQKENLKREKEIIENQSINQYEDTNIVNNTEHYTNTNNTNNNTDQNKQKMEEELAYKEFLLKTMERKELNKNKLPTIELTSQLKEAILIFVIYIILSIPQVQSIFFKYFPHLAPNIETGAIPISGAIIIGLIIAVSFTFVRKYI